MQRAYSTAVGFWFIVALGVVVAQMNTRLKNSADAVQVHQTKIGTLLTIVSPSGIGWAEISAPEAGWGKTLLLQFFFLRLEHVVIRAETFVLECNQISSNNKNQHRCSIGNKRLQVIKKTINGYEMRLPPAFVKAKNLKIEWVNEFR